MAAFSSAKRSPRRVCVAIDLVTQRLMQPVSRPESALDVKSSTHALKQLSTRLLKTWCCRVCLEFAGCFAWVGEEEEEEEEEGWMRR